MDLTVALLTEVASEYLSDKDMMKLAKTIILSQDLIRESLDRKNQIYKTGYKDSAKEAIKKTGLNPVWTNAIIYMNIYRWGMISKWAKDFLKITQN